MDKLKIKGAIFDMDGTLVDSLMFWEEFWLGLGKKYLGVDDFSVSDEIDKTVRTMTFAESMPYVNKMFHFHDSDEELVNYAIGIIKPFYRDKVVAKAGVFEFLDYLKDSGVKMCIASATDTDNLRFAIENCGLGKYFEVIYSCTEIGVGKDRPDIYYKSRDALGLDVSEICVFEDSYVALETARTAGFKTVGVFDRYNYGQDRLRAASDIYIGDGEDMSLLIERIKYN